MFIIGLGNLKDDELIFNDALDIRETDITFSGTFDEDNQINIPNHGLITGEKVTYVAGDGDNKLDLTEGEYFVKKVDINNIQLSKSNVGGLQVKVSLPF